MMGVQPAHGEAERFERPRLGEPYLLTPGPLTTAYEVKEAMLRDWGSWDGDFRAMTADLRSHLLDLAGDAAGEFDCVPMQGSGTFSVEAMLGSLVPRDGKALVLMNGAYGKRIAQTLDYLGRAYTTIDKGDYMPPRGQEVAAAIDADRGDHACGRRALRDEFGHPQSGARDCRGRPCARTEAAHQFHERLRRRAGRRERPQLRGDRFLGQQMHRGRAGLRLRHRAQERARGRARKQPFPQPRPPCPVGLHEQDGAVALHAADACGCRLPQGAGTASGRRRRRGPRRALCPQPRRDGRRNARARLRDAAAGTGGCRRSSSPSSIRRTRTSSSTASTR